VLFSLAVLSSTTLIAQPNAISAGIEAGTNYSALHFTNQGGEPSSYEWRWKFGLAAGAYVNVPFGNMLSIQPNVLFAQTGATLILKGGTESSRIRQTLNYASFPVFLKFTPATSVSFLLGPQFDLGIGAHITNESGDKIVNKNNFQQFDIALSGGLQLMPNSSASLSIRYVYGLRDIVGTASHPIYITNSNSGKLNSSAIQATVSYRIFKRHRQEVALTTPEVPLMVDSDGDGIADDMDKCPSIPGIVKYDGCPIPDSDNDGINDDMDKCPNVSGVAKYDGCPVPDSDHDGIDDDHDKCPTVPGTERYQGCPVPDSDSDGISDDEDRCPYLAGTLDNRGCPEIDGSKQETLTAIAKRISWSSATGSELSKLSEILLDEMAGMLIADSNLKVSISVFYSGGNTDKNKSLGQHRADAIKNYLITKRVNESQVQATGYSENWTITRNQWIELKLHY